MVFKHTEVWGFEHALRGMRNPKNSWDRGDSQVSYCDNCAGYEDGCSKCQFTGNCDLSVRIGKNDMKLAQQLIRAGSEHRKFMRQIFVSVDITAPLYWWKEFDTYKVGTVANSTSTMHKLATTPITIDCFETDNFDSLPVKNSNTGELTDLKTSLIEPLIDLLEELRQEYINTKDKRYWKEIVRWLPESWLQTRTVTMNYENLLAMCSKGQRRFHKLTEWSESFMSWARNLPYAQELIFIDEEV